MNTSCVRVVSLYFVSHTQQIVVPSSLFVTIRNAHCSTGSRFISVSACCAICSSILSFDPFVFLSVVAHYLPTHTPRASCYIALLKTMKARDLIEWSLTLKKVQKLIICRGCTSAESSEHCDAIGYHVGRTLLSQCGPSPSDIHDAEGNRAPGRDAHGRTRPYYTHRANNQTSRRGGRGGAAAARSPQLWDSERVADFGGVWCDRLLLGDHLHPSRSALLLPTVPLEMEGDCVSRAAHTLRHLKARDVLLVSATSALPFGVVRLHQGNVPPEFTPHSALSRAASSVFTPLDTALSLFGRVHGGGEDADGVFSLWVGTSDGANARGPRSILSSEDATFAKTLLLPLTAFATALWTTNPTACATYLEKATATPTSLTAQTANQRLWQTMQAAMLSTRDTALLEAHFTGKTLDARLSSQQQCYLAETLLRRLEEDRR